MGIHSIIAKNMMFINRIGLSENDIKTLSSIFAKVGESDIGNNKVLGEDVNTNANVWKSFCKMVKNKFASDIANKIISGIESNNIVKVGLSEDESIKNDHTYFVKPLIQNSLLIPATSEEAVDMLKTMEANPEPSAKMIEKTFTQESTIKTDEYIDKEKFLTALDNLLENKNKSSSKLIGIGSDIVEIANGMDIDPFLVAAISIQESGWGCSNVAKTHNNLMGINDCTAAKKQNKHFVPRDYALPVESIKTGVTTLNSRVNEGYNTFHQVAFSGRYCAPNESEGWEKNALSIANKLREEYNKLFE